MRAVLLCLTGVVLGMTLCGCGHGKWSSEKDLRKRFKDNEVIINTLVDMMREDDLLQRVGLARIDEFNKTSDGKWQWGFGVSGDTSVYTFDQVIRYVSITERRFNTYVDLMKQIGCEYIERERTGGFRIVMMREGTVVTGVMKSYLYEPNLPEKATLVENTDTFAEATGSDGKVYSRIKGDWYIETYR